MPIPDGNPSPTDSCVECDLANRSGEGRGDLALYRPYVGYDIVLPFHETCFRLARMRTQKCFWGLSPAHKQNSNLGPLWVWMPTEEDPSGAPSLPSVSHEPCALGGSFVLPDGSTRGKCLICQRTQTGVLLYDLGDGQLAWLDAKCAGPAGLAPLTASDAFVEGIGLGVFAGVIGHALRGR